MKVEILLIISLLVILQNVQVNGEILSVTCVPVDQVPNSSANAFCEGSVGYSYTFLNTTSNTCEYSAKVDQSCNSNTGPACDGYLGCLNSTCHYIYYLTIGDACSSDFSEACNSEECINGTCSAPNGGCTTMHHCPVGQYCDSASHTCLTQKNEGASCDGTSNSRQCHYGLFCSDLATCKSLFSLQLNDSCTLNNQCDYSKGLYCSGNNNNQCALYSQTKGNCTAEPAICNSNEWCDASTSTCQVLNTISSAAENATMDYYSCLRQYGCMDDEMYGSVFSPLSCAMKHCGTLVCEYLSYYSNECDPNIYDNPLCAGYEPTLAPTETPSSSNQLASSLLFTLILLFLIF